MLLSVPNFQATFNADGTILSTGPAALDTVLRVQNISWATRIVNICVWNEHEELVFDFNIWLKGLDVQSFSVASLLHGDDPRALPCPHAPTDPRHGPFRPAFLFSVLSRLSHGHPPNDPVDNVVRNPLHGYITINDLHGNGRESSLRADYFIGKPDSAITNLDARLVELTVPDDLPVVYSRPSWRGLGVVLKETRMKVREAIRLIESDGWYYVTSRGSHRQYKHPQKRGRVTIPGKLNDDLAPGTFNSILKQAGLKA
jgi:predicted RNA binding protein YcfA (HicA-like mRNA interferase family)